MIPSLDKPKYKPLVRFRIEVWKTLLCPNKTLKRKKWRFILSQIKRNKNNKNIYYLINYQAKTLSKFPVYQRYRFQKDLHLRQHIKLIYGRIQDFHIKNLALNLKNKSYLEFAQHLEQRVLIFLYRIKLVKTYGEAKLHHYHKRILINGSFKKIDLKKGDVLHFTPVYEKLLKRRIYKNYLNKKKFKYGLNQCLDLDLTTIRFIFLEDIKYFKNHPFKLPFERVIRWYTHV